MSSIDYNKERALMMLKYNTNLDETTLAVVHILTSEINSKIAEQNNAIDNAVQKIDASNRSLALDYNHPKSQAFWFGMGKWGLPLTIALSILLGYILYLNYESKVKIEDYRTYNWLVNYYNKTKELSIKERKKYEENNPIPLYK